MAIIVLVTFLMLILIVAVPIPFALLASSILYFLFEGIPLQTIIIRLVNTYKSFLLLSIPFFILSGKIMTYAKISEKLVDFADLLVGRLKGGLAQINIVVSMFFGGCTGSAIADTSAIGSILIPTMVKKGYTGSFSAAVTAASSTMGPIIPPSIMFILYGASAQVSVGDLFLAGAIPGITIGLGQMLLVSFYAHKYDFPQRKRKFEFKESAHIVKEASWALLLPILILGGIISGFVTPTEAAIIAVVYSTFLALFIYRTLSLKDLLYVFREAAVESGKISILLAACSLFTWILVIENIPLKVSELLLSSGFSKPVILLLINLGLLLIGMLIDSFPAILLVTPVLLPLYRMLDINLLHAGIFSCMMLVIGVITPPVGCCLFSASIISKEPFEKVVVAIIPFIIVNVAVALLITFIPQISLFLPNIFK